MISHGGQKRYRRKPMKYQAICKIVLILLVCTVYPITVRAQATPLVKVGVKSLDCGIVKTGGASEPGIVTIGNAGTGNLDINSIGITGLNAAEFSQTNDCSTIPAGGSCSILVTFSPVTPGKKSGVVAIASNDSRAPLLNVKLKALSPPPKIGSSLKSVKFPPVSIGGASTPVGITISNIGVSDLIISSISVTGVNAPDFGQTHDCATVPAGGSCSVSLTFVPSSAGKRAAVLGINSNDPKKPLFSIKMSGSASGQVMLVSPAANAALTTTCPTLSWQQYGNATEYHLHVSTSSKFEPPVTREVITSATSFASPLLTAGTSYFWRVYAVTPFGATLPSASRKISCTSGSTFAPLNGAVYGTSPRETTSAHPTVITSRNKTGEEFRFIAYPGEVLIRMAEDVPVETATSLVKNNGGIVYAAVPAAGYYWAAVEKGKEAEFIDDMNVSAQVLNAVPNRAGQVKQVVVPASEVPNFNEWVRNYGTGDTLDIGTGNLLQFDDFSTFLDACGGTTHGAMVGSIAGEHDVPVAQYDVMYPGGFTEGLDLNWLHWAILSSAEAAERSGRNLVLNFSIGPDGPNDGVDRHGCIPESTNPDCAAIRVETGNDGVGNDDMYCEPGEACEDTIYQDYQQANRGYLEAIAGTLDFLRRKYPEQFKRIGVVVAAGNDGLDLSAITTLRTTFPEAFGNMLVVGGTDEHGARWSGGNSSIETDDVMYAPITNPGCPGYPGTSYAGPKVSNVLARLAADEGGAYLTMGQLIEAMKTAGLLTGIYRNVPTFEAALDVVKTMVPTYTLTVGKTGTGNGTVSVNPSEAPYAAGTLVTLTASPDSSSTFEGWSGDCSGTGPCSIVMDADKFVTANFAPEEVVPIAGNWKGTYTMSGVTECGPLSDTGTMSIAVTQSGSHLDGTATLTNMSAYEVDDDGNILCSSVKKVTARPSFSADHQPLVNEIPGLGAVDNAYHGVLIFDGAGLGFWINIEGNRIRGVWELIAGSISLSKD
jgi:hypothetical protein